MRRFLTTKVHIITVLSVLVVCVLMMMFFKFLPVSAGAAESMQGFAWGGTNSASGAYNGIGWVSTNNLSDGAPVNYGVNVPSGNGNLSGYAWSTHYGWISFNAADLSGCSPALSAAARSGNSIVGGARIISIRDAGSNAGGFDGCVSLSGGGYGVSISGSASPYALSGYAWSSDLGWIDFSGTQIHFSTTATLSASPCTIALGANSCNGTLTWAIEHAASPNVFNTTTGVQYSTNPIGNNVSASFVYGSNQIAARNGGSNLSTVNVSTNCTSPGTWNGATNRCEDQRPNLTQPNITYTPGTFNVGTGMYDSVTVIFQTSNNGTGNIPAGAQYEFQFDRGQNGYDHTVNGSIGSVNVGQTTNYNEVVSGNIPLGNNRIRISVDSTNAIAETNESDNVRTLDIAIAPPNPGLSITANPTQVKTGQNSTISWTMTTPYAMDCSVFGPGMSTVNFNPATNGPSGSVSAGPITSKSIYTFQCEDLVTGTSFSDTAIVEAQGQLEEI